MRGVTGADGLRDEVRVYPPYGPFTGSESWDFDLATPNATQGYIGERHDPDAGLQFLNARYYDPKLALFIQPDWWEVTDPGVGTNRFAYAGNDPVNARDPGGNSCGSSGPFEPTVSCNGNLVHDVFASIINTFTSDLSNLLSSPLIVIGAAAAPYDSAITNLAMTTPIPHDDAVAAGLRGSSYLYGRAAARMAPSSEVVFKEGQAIGKFAPSGKNVPGTTRFGNEAHEAIADQIVERLVGMGAAESRIITRIKPGQNGVDIEFDPIDAARLGLKPNIDIKPNNLGGERTFNRQLSNWGLDRSNTQAVTYDPDGTIYWGFTY